VSWGDEDMLMDELNARQDAARKAHQPGRDHERDRQLREIRKGLHGQVMSSLMVMLCAGPPALALDVRLTTEEARALFPSATFQDANAAFQTWRIPVKRPTLEVVR
jgi:hypothetical protein